MEKFKEAVKEGLRVVVLAIIPVLIDAVTAGAVNWNIVAVAGMIALLRFIDKYLHEMEPEGKAGGLVRF